MPTICFITRKQNTQWFGQNKFQQENTIDRARVSEEQGLALSSLSFTPNILTADIIHTRLNPERTSDWALKRAHMAERQAKESAIVLNSSSYFRNYAEKTRCFMLWQKNDIPHPHFETWSPWRSKRIQLQTIAKLLSTYGSLYLRTSNEDSGKGIYFLQREMTKSQISSVIRSLRVRSLVNKVSRSQILAVAPVNTQNADGISHVYRVHVSCNQILGGYALVGTGAVIHAKDQRLENWQAYVEHNAILKNILNEESFRNKVLDAVKVLQADVGAIEFFLVDGKPIFLEFNPLWGGIHRFGDSSFHEHLTANLQIEELSLVKRWLSPSTFYKTMFESFALYWKTINKS